MPISIQEIFYSDTIAEQLEKINYNFDQIVLSGGGPIGPTGPQGPIGPGGPAGRRGENIYWDDGTGIGSAPLTGLIIGDQFVLANGDVYEWDGVSWVLTGTNIKGPTGATGPAGSSVDIKRWVGGFNSTFGVTTSWYPQIPEALSPSGDIDYITLRQGGLDNLYLGDADSAYGLGGPGSNSGIESFPNKNNSAKLWVIQNQLVGGGKNGITIGAIGAKRSADASSTVANYSQFANIFLDNTGNLNLSITAGQTGDPNSEPKNIYLTTDSFVSIQSGDLLNNQFSVGLDPGDGLVGIFGNLRDKIELETLNVHFNIKQDFNLNIDSDGGTTGIAKFTKSNLPIISPTVRERMLTLNTVLPVSNDTTHYSEGLSVTSGTSSAKFELFKFGTKNIASIGVQNGTVNEGKNLLITDSGKVLIGETVSYPLTALSTWVDDPINDGLGTGSLAVYDTIRMNSAGSPENALLWSDSDGVFGYASATLGVPGNNTQFEIGMWGYEVAENRIYNHGLQNNYINLGQRELDDGISQLVISKRPLSSRDARLLIKTNDNTDFPEIVFDLNGKNSTLKQSPQTNGNRQFQLPRSKNQGGVVMTFTDNNGQFNDNWEEYQKLRDDTAFVLTGAGLIKDNLQLSAFGGLVGGYTNNPVDLNKIPIASGIDWINFSGNDRREKRFPSKIHLKRVNEDFYILNFAINIWLDINSFTTIGYDNFNFFEFSFKSENPGELKGLRNQINALDDEGGVWYPCGAYKTGYDLLIPATSTTADDRLEKVVDSSTHNTIQPNIGSAHYQALWNVERQGVNEFRIQIALSEPIPKGVLQFGIMFTGNGIVYGKTV